MIFLHAFKIPTETPVQNSLCKHMWHNVIFHISGNIRYSASVHV